MKKEAVGIAGTKWQAMSLLATLGVSLIIPIAFFAFSGVFIDQKYGLSPIFTLLGTIFGLLISFYFLYRQLKPFLKKKKSYNIKN